jgi:hypothetical protein
MIWMRSAIFSGAYMRNANFQKASLTCGVLPVTLENGIFFQNVTLIGGQFQQARFCLTRFHSVDLAYINFSEVTFGLRIEFINTNLIYSDLRYINISEHPTSMKIANVNMTGTQLDSKVWFSEPIFQYEQLANLVLPNDTWLVDGKNLIDFGDARSSVSDTFEYLTLIFSYIVSYGSSRSYIAKWLVIFANIPVST